MLLVQALRDERLKYNESHKSVVLPHEKARFHVSQVVETYFET